MKDQAAERLAEALRGIIPQAEHSDPCEGARNCCLCDARAALAAWEAGE